MRRVLPLIACFALLLLLLAGCGGSQEAKTNEPHVSEGGPTNSTTAAACAANRRMIDTAIQQYKAMEGTPPTSLQQLVPRYLETMPSCPSGGSYSIQGEKAVCSVHGS